MSKIKTMVESFVTRLSSCLWKMVLAWFYTLFLVCQTENESFIHIMWHVKWPLAGTQMKCGSLPTYTYPPTSWSCLYFIWAGCYLSENIFPVRPHFLLLLNSNMKKRPEEHGLLWRQRLQLQLLVYTGRFQSWVSCSSFRTFNKQLDVNT